MLPDALMGEDLSTLQRFFTKYDCYHFQKSQSKETAEA
jgi:hypothetical protein